MHRLALLFALASCYDAPKPVCGFRCGPATACPADYTCAANGHCRLASASPDLPCPVHDAAIDAFDYWPFILEVSPLEDAIGVSVDAVVTVKFTERVSGVSATSFTLQREDTAAPLASNVTYDAPTRVATLDPIAPLDVSTRYVATLGDEIMDARGNRLFGKRSWAFKTMHDVSAPSVLAVSPEDGSTTVPVDTIVIVTFSEQVSHTTSGLIVESPTAPIAGAIGYVSQTAVKLTPAQPLAPYTTYTVTMTSTITDLVGNPLANAPVVSSFTTGADTIAPVLTSHSPLDDDTDVPVTAAVTARFSEPVIGVSTTSMIVEDATGVVDGTVTYVETTRTARFAPTAPLAASTTYTVTLTAAITDGSANPLAPQTWTFTTAAP